MIELLVYASLSIFFVMIIMQFFSQYERDMVNSSSEAFRIACVQAALDAIVRDCASAPADLRMWPRAERESIAWKSQQGIQGFSFVHDRLVRVSKKINKAGKLQAASYSTLLNGVQGNFSITKSQGYVSALTIIVQSHVRNHIFSINKTVYLHEGVLS